MDIHRDIRAYGRKIKKALSKKNKFRADRLEERKPTYKLDRLIIERYVLLFRSIFGFFFCFQ